MPSVFERASAACRLLAALGSLLACERPSRAPSDGVAPDTEGPAASRLLQPSGMSSVAGEILRAAPLTAGAPPDAAVVGGGSGRTASPAPTGTLTLIAGGDVSFGRLIGQILLKEPERDLFATLAPLLATADVRFCNLEGPLSEQKGETVSSRNNLVFTGPPSGADALARSGVTAVSTANNHAWDYGRKALFETIDNLDRVGVRHVGTGKNREEAYRPLVLDSKGFRLAMVAVTDIWNDGPLAKHPAAEHVAAADMEALPAAVRGLRADATIDAIVVSYHGLAEYMDEPLPRTRDLLRAAIDAGADAVIGHHPHVINGVEWRKGRPILYSLGNLLMRMNSAKPWTEMGYLARLRLSRGEAPAVEVCPFRMYGIVPLRFVGDPARAAYETKFFAHLRAISASVGGTEIGAPGADGCAAVSPVKSAGR